MLPILQRLARGRDRKIRALVIVPTRDWRSRLTRGYRLFGGRTRSRPSTAASGGGRLARSGAARRSSSPAPAGCSTIRARGHRPGSVEFWCSTRPTGCSTWAFCPTSARSARSCPIDARTCCSARPSCARSARWPRACCGGITTGDGEDAAVNLHKLRPPGRPRAQARAAHAPRAHACHRPGARVHPHEARCQQARRAAQPRRDRDRGDPRDGWQPQRVRALADFKAGRVLLLVATEVAARGLDIEALPHVGHFELPMVPADYLHRIGRTGRAGDHRARPSRWCASTRRRCPVKIERLLRHPVQSPGRHSLQAGSVDPAAATASPIGSAWPSAASHPGVARLCPSSGAAPLRWWPPTAPTSCSELQRPVILRRPRLPL